MFNWLHSALYWLNQTFGAVVQWLEQFVIGVPIYVAGPSMIIIGALLEGATFFALIVCIQIAGKA